HAALRVAHPGAARAEVGVGAVAGLADREALVDHAVAVVVHAVADLGRGHTGRVADPARGAGAVPLARPAEAGPSGVAGRALLGRAVVGRAVAVVVEDVAHLDVGLARHRRADHRQPVVRADVDRVRLALADADAAGEAEHREALVDLAVAVVVD